MSLAKSERAMVGALTVLEGLHAAEPQRHLDEGLFDALLLAGRC